MQKWKIKKFFKNIGRSLGFAFQLPHFITLLVLFVIAIVSLVISINTRNNTLSSILSNIFAGLMTGIAICLISGFRGFTIYRIKGKIEWLERLHNDCMEFKKNHRELLKMKFDDLNQLYDAMYDTICYAGAINSTITQSQFNKKLSFNAKTFCEKKLKYDIEENEKIFLQVRENIINTDINTITKKDLINLFREVETIVMVFNGAIINKIEELKIKQSMINRFFI